MELGDFRVVEQSRLDGAVIHVEAGRRLFVTRIDTAVFEAYFGRPRISDDPKRHLTKRECNLLATSNHVTPRLVDHPTTTNAFVWPTGQKFTTGLEFSPNSRPANVLLVPLSPVSDQIGDSRSCSEGSTLTTFEGAVSTSK